MKKTILAAIAFASAFTAFPNGEVPFRGVVEGYYGRAWGTEGRISMLEFMGRNGLNTFIYGPKDDPYHHQRWREPYPAEEMAGFRRLLDCARKNKVKLYWAIHLGGSFNGADKADWAALFRKLGLMYDAGFRAFAVFFDDFGGADAALHAEICNRIVRDFLSKRKGCEPLVMCPNVYWGSGHPYHRTLGERLDGRVMVMWTGAGICSDIRASDVERITKDLRRPPFIWWNWPVNDYCRSALLLGRAYGLEPAPIAGIVANPMENCEASKIALYGFAKWCADPKGFDSLKCWNETFDALYPDPEIARAMRVFAEHNSDQGPNVHRYRREESVSAKALCEKASGELSRDGRVSAITAMELAKLFSKVYHASKTLGAKLPKGRYDLGWEIEGWVENEEFLMGQGMLALKLSAANAVEEATPYLALLSRIREDDKASAARHCRKFAEATFAADRKNVKRPVASARELRPLVDSLLSSALGRLYKMKYSREAPHAETVRAFSSAKALSSPTASRDGKYAGLARIMEPIEIAPDESFGISVPGTWTTDYFHARLGCAEAVSGGAIEVSQDGETWYRLESFDKGTEMQARIDPDDGWRHARYRNVSDAPVKVKIELFKFDIADADDPMDAVIKELLTEGIAVRLAPDGTNDMTSALLDAVSRGGKVTLAAGTYHFYAENARKMRIYISNHDQPMPRRVQLPICGVDGLSLSGEGEGAKFIFHGEATGILVMDSSNVKISGISLDWAEPPIGEARIKGFSSPGVPSIEWIVEGCDGKASARMLWDGETRSIKPGTGDWFDIAKAKVGDVISYRTWLRPSPAICLYRASGVKFEDVVIHSAHGMGLLAQRSKDIEWRGGGVYPRSGCFCSTKADATHFSNCRGRISVTGARFEGMMDDAINVHSTCLRIEKKLAANRIRCRYVHDQAIGFETFAPGETLRFIRAATLENGPVAKVVAVDPQSERLVDLTLDDAGAAALAGYAEGDAVENADWQPSVVFSSNTVRNNRARAALFTTPGRVTVKGNVFDHVSGSAILFAGDASNWYESGACGDVEISGNEFIDCLTSEYQFCNAVITSAPSVPDLAGQKTPYHRNIRVVGNTFRCPGAVIWDGVSVADVVWRDNKVESAAK